VAGHLHSTPQKEIASILRDRIARSKSVAIVAGFLTPDGLKALALAQHAQKLERLVIGAGTYAAFTALDTVIGAGAPLGGIRVHLGHTKRNSGKRHPFVRYHPMLHSKIYLFDMHDDTAVAFVGSHNMTGFALNGLNGEAGVLLEGPRSDPAFCEIRSHIDEAFAQACRYDASLKQAYTWWTREYFEGLSAEANDAPRDFAPKRTVVIIARQGSKPPSIGDVIYFEIEAALNDLRSLDTDVHVYLFATLPTSPSEALANLHLASESLACKVVGLEVESGGLELDAQWSIDDKRQPEVRPTVRPFRPAASPKMQQVRVRVEQLQLEELDYSFDAVANVWEPLFEAYQDGEVALPDGWRLVSDLVESEKALPNEIRLALEATAPQSGSYVLFSRRRRRKKIEKSGVGARF
jgi:HKD family nuclease